MQGRGGGLSGVTKVSVSDECGDYVWVTSGGVAPLYRWFLVRLVSASESSVVSRSSGWANSAAGQMMTLISPSYTSCIIYSLLMSSARSGVMADLVGKFLFESTYYELLLHPPKLAADVTSLSGLAGNLGVLD